MTNILGLILSLILIMYLAYKGYSTIITAPIVALVTILITTGLDAHLMASYTEIYMSGFASFIKNYFDKHHFYIKIKKIIIYISH